MLEPNDQQLAQRLQAGDEAALDDIMQRYKKPVLNFVYRLLGNAADAEDVAQETFARLYQHIARYKSREKFSSWLFAIARNAALDKLRYRKRHPTGSLDTAPDPGFQSREVELNETGQLIAAAIATLPEDQRTAIILAEYHDQSYADIAAVMGCSVKSVESRLYRAKQTLREKLQGLMTNE
jgi:RNA polymerase sigma-70 factor (ECF subfamily)